MFDGKFKAVTFSYDDGVTQDKRLISLFDKYHVKATFNINSDLLGKTGALNVDGKEVTHNKINPAELREIYRNHEVAVHTLTHPNLTQLDDAEVIRQVENDRLRLSGLCGYDVVGMAYPCGGVNNDERVARIIREKTGVRYARTITSSHSFDPQEDLYRFNPTVYHRETDKMFELGEKFVALKPDRPQIFYLWGHSYELDAANGWETIEKFLRLIAGRDDIYYGTNTQVLLAGR